MARGRDTARPGRDDVVRDDGRDALAEEGQSERRTNHASGDDREPAAPMSPTPQPGPLGDEPDDPADPATPRGETIR